MKILSILALISSSVILLKSLTIVQDITVAIHDRISSGGGKCCFEMLQGSDVLSLDLLVTKETCVNNDQRIFKK